MVGHERKQRKRMISAVGYLISTHIGYAGPLEHLLLSMKHIDPSVVFIVSGGHDRYNEVKRQDGHRVFEVPHNSFDYTALITLVEQNWAVPDHLFPLHDTMELGPNAVRLIASAPDDCPAVAVWHGFCNLMLLRTDYVRSRAR